jgi:signal transduction histidine kinase
VLLLVGVGGVNHWNTNAAVSATKWVAHTHRVLETLNALGRDFAEAESSGRGYALTGQEPYLTPYFEALRSLAQNLERIVSLTRDRPDQQARLRELSPLVAARIALVEQSIALRRIAGFEAAQKLALTHRGRHLTSDIHGRIEKIRSVEMQLLAERQAASDVQIRRIGFVVGAGGVASLLLLGTIFFWLRREIGTRREIEQSIRTLNDELETQSQCIRKLNSELSGRVVELTDLNTELESFSSTVAHDLRAPLRAIDGFARILLEEHLTQLDPEAQRCLNVISKNAKRMGALIDDLLTFSRIGRKEMSLGPVDMNQLLAEVLEDHLAEASGAAARAEIRDLPPALGDWSLLREVLINLLSNAVKYSRTRSEPQIEIGATPEGVTNLYFVRDNGVGFDMEYADWLFKVFQRLHTDQEFEGTGVGLAIVQRIVHRHGGRVWVEAKLDEGATFFFTLPAA